MDKVFVPISKNIIEPVIKTNIEYVNSLEEFEALELEPNQAALKFDNFKPCFYIKERDCYGDYSPVMIYFYENFTQKARDLEKDEFIKKCKKSGLDDFKTEVAIKFFLENKKPYDVWIWVTSEQKKDWSWDYVKTLKYRLKLKLFSEVAKSTMDINKT